MIADAETIIYTDGASKMVCSYCNMWHNLIHKLILKDCRLWSTQACPTTYMCVQQKFNYALKQEKWVQCM